MLGCEEKAIKDYAANSMYSVVIHGGSFPGNLGTWREILVAEGKFTFFDIKIRKKLWNIWLSS